MSNLLQDIVRSCLREDLASRSVSVDYGPDYSGSSQGVRNVGEPSLGATRGATGKASTGSGKTRVALIGDSHGQGLFPIISRDLTAKGMEVVYNMAIPGASEDRFLKEGIPATLKKLQPNIVVYCLGGNNQDMNESSYMGRVKSLVDAAKMGGARRVLYVGPATATRDDVKTRHASTANMLSKGVQGLGAEWLDSRPLTTSGHRADGVHFTNYSSWAAKIAEVVAKGEPQPTKESTQRRQALSEDLGSRAIRVGLPELDSDRFSVDIPGVTSADGVLSIPLPRGAPAEYSSVSGDTQDLKDFIAVFGPAYQSTFGRPLVVGSTYRNLQQQARAMRNPLNNGDFDGLYRKALGVHFSEVKSLIRAGRYPEAAKIMANTGVATYPHVMGRGIDIGFGKNGLRSSDHGLFKTIVNQVAYRYGFKASVNSEKKDHFHITVSGRTAGAQPISKPQVAAAQGAVAGSSSASPLPDMMLQDADSLYAGTTRNADKIEYIVVHHSVTYPNKRDGTPKTMDEIVSEVAKIHHSKDITGIAYNKLIMPSGQLFTSRPDEYAPGSQMNYNKGTLAVCVIGYFHDNKDSLRPAQLDSLKRVIADWKRAHPNAIVVGHRQIGDTQTECPGDDLFDWLEDTYADVRQVGSKRIRRSS